jgi:hypothetical protein
VSKTCCSASSKIYPNEGHVVSLLASDEALTSLDTGMDTVLSEGLKKASATSWNKSAEMWTCGSIAGYFEEGFLAGC